MRRRTTVILMVACVLLAGAWYCYFALQARWARPTVVIGVCDPLARETASDCVKSRAVREYDAMFARLGSRAAVTLRVVYVPFDAPLVDAMRAGRVDAVIGKTWTVLRAGAGWVRIADLADPNGSGKLSGVFVARADSPLTRIADLDGKRLLLGPDGAYEKSFAARNALAAAGATPDCVEIIDGCVPLAAELIEKRADAGVISSYVADFGGFDLVGGASRFKEIGRTEAIPFMTFAASPKLDPAIRGRLRAALLEMAGHDVPDGLYSTGFTEPAPWNPEEDRQ